ncbi:MAG: hypothetical protein ACR2ML_06145 [Solirubrobacteraceae bacterium]
MPLIQYVGPHHSVEAELPDGSVVAARSGGAPVEVSEVQRKLLVTEESGGGDWSNAPNPDSPAVKSGKE